MSKEIIIGVPEDIASDKIVLAVERAVIDLGLNVTMRGTLKSFPNSTHWHLKRGRQRGTIEITWWPLSRKLWIKVQAGRTAAWIDDDATTRLTRQIESRLHRLARSA